MKSAGHAVTRSMSGAGQTAGQCFSVAQSAGASLSSMTQNLRMGTLSFNRHRSIESPRGHSIVMPKEVLPFLDRLSTSDWYEPNQGEELGCLQKCASRVAETSFFSGIMGLLIMVNVGVVVIETDQIANDSSSTISHTSWTSLFGWTVLGLFTLELTVRLAASGVKTFFVDGWNTFDFVVVTVDLTFSVVDLLAGHSLPVSTLRVFRVARLARVSKVLRIFPELRLLMAALMSSMTAIFWGTFLMLLMLLMWSVAAVLIIHPLNKDMQYDIKLCARCPRAFSSVFQSALTFCQQIIAGENWGAIIIPLIEKHPITAVFFFAVFVTLGMAVMNLILGVIVSVAQQAKDDLAHQDRAAVALKKLKQKTRLLDLCKMMDTDGSGTIDRREFYKGFQQDTDLQETIYALDITEDDFEIVWTIIDPDGKGYVSYKELVAQLSTLRSSDMQFMLCYTKYYITSVRNKLLLEMSMVHRESMDIAQNIAQINIENQKANDMMRQDAKVLVECKQALEELDNVMCHAASIAPHRSNGSSESLALRPIASDLASVGRRKSIRSSLRSDLSAEVNSFDHKEYQSDVQEVTSPSEYDPTEIWLRKVCKEFSKMQLELEEILKDMRNQTSPKVWSASGDTSMSIQHSPDIEATQIKVSL